MSAEPSPDVKFEIGHVLFIDIVGYSKLLLDKQKEQLRQLTDIVLATPQVRESTNEQLVRLPTGDGMALVFRNSAEEPARCALELARALKQCPGVLVRMGIHSGPVSEVVDISRRTNIAGAGINMAQRVMDCGDAGHILLSKHVAEDLGHLARWQRYLHDLGEVEVKHGVRVAVVNLYNDRIGNRQLPRKFQLQRKRRARKRWGMAAAALFLLAATAAAFILVSRHSVQSLLPETSLAVLPLVNMSGDPKNDYFSDGISEELIGILAKIPTLKIISRSSSFLFKGTSDDSRTIGKKLGVTNLLEGTVRKEGDHVRIVAELINAADGRAVWSQTYNRELKDVFAVQSEIATAVTDELKIKLLGAPAKSDAAPSNEENLAAYNAFQEGNFYLRGNIEDTRKAIDFYNEAIRLDPKYALAYAQLANSWRVMCILGGDNQNSPYASECGPHCALAYAKARTAVETALSLAPNLAHAYLVKGLILLNQDRDFDGATTQYRKAEELEPGSDGPKAALAFLLMINGRLEEAEGMTRKSLLLDPLNTAGYEVMGKILIARERYDEAEAFLRKGIELVPQKVRWHVHITAIDLLKGKPKAALEEAQLEPPGAWQDYAIALAQQAQGDRAAADAALQKYIEKNGDAPFQIASMYALRKEPDKMFEWLNRAYATNDLGLPQLLIAPFLNKYRDDPRFAALWQKIKLPAAQAAETDK
jgi:serine/threonine-protein kinase